MRPNTLPKSAIAVPTSLLATRTDQGSALAYLRALDADGLVRLDRVQLLVAQEVGWNVELFKEDINIKGLLYHRARDCLSGPSYAGNRKVDQCSV